MIRALSAEAVVLAFTGGSLGVFAAYAGLPVLLRLVQGSLAINATQLPLTANVSLNGAVLLAALVSAALAGALFGVLPALRTSDVDLRSALTGTERHGADRSTGRFRSALVVLEIATATVLLASSTFVFRNLYEMRALDLGFSTERLLTLGASFPTTKYSDEEQLSRVATRLRERLSEVSDVEWADTWGLGRPGLSFSVQSIVPEGMVVDELGKAPRARVIGIGPGGLRKIGIPLASGREFTDADRLDATPVAVVSKSLASKLWPGEDAVGRRLRPFVPMDAPPSEVPLWIVVGVAADANHGGRIPSPNLIQTGDDIYFPISQQPVSSITLVVRTRGEGDLERIQNAVWSVDPDIPLFDIATMDQLLAREEGPTRFSALLMTAFAVAALLLAALASMAFSRLP